MPSSSSAGPCVVGLRLGRHAELVSTTYCQNCSPKLGILSLTASPEEIRRPSREAFEGPSKGFGNLGIDLGICLGRAVSEGIWSSGLQFGQ